MARRIRRWRVLWTEPAQDDLREVFRFIRRDNLTAAQKVIQEIREKVGGLAQFPLSGREVPELPGTGLREVIAGSYRVIYRLVSNSIEVLTVLHSRRKVGK